MVNFNIKGSLNYKKTLKFTRNSMMRSKFGNRLPTRHKCKKKKARVKEKEGLCSDLYG